MVNSIKGILWTSAEPGRVLPRSNAGREPSCNSARRHFAERANDTPKLFPTKLNDEWVVALSRGRRRGAGPPRRRNVGDVGALAEMVVQARPGRREGGAQRFQSGRIRRRSLGRSGEFGQGHGPEISGRTFQAVRSGPPPGVVVERIRQSGEVALGGREKKGGELALKLPIAVGERLQTIEIDERGHRVTPIGARRERLGEGSAGQPLGGGAAFGVALDLLKFP